MMKVSTGCYPIWFRQDLAREQAQAYWRGRHAQIAGNNPAILEYLQHHFSQDGHGFWPVSGMIGGMIPPDWAMDGVTEVRIGSMWTAICSRLLRMKANVLDEQNVFERVLAKNSAPGGSGWWSGPYRSDTGFRAAVFLRARSDSRGRPFKYFVEQALAPALMAAGVSELRTHVFTRGSRLAWWTPGVRHDEPANHYADAMLLIGAQSRETLMELLDSEIMTATQAEQQAHCVAIHAYAIEQTYPIVLDYQRQPINWN